jgi:hypothetical protein
MQYDLSYKQELLIVDNVDWYIYPKLKDFTGVVKSVLTPTNHLFFIYATDKQKEHFKKSRDKTYEVLEEVRKKQEQISKINTEIALLKDSLEKLKLEEAIYKE